MGDSGGNEDNFILRALLCEELRGGARMHAKFVRV